MGIDVGTASTKGALTTETGELVATAERRHAVSMPRPGWFEQDGELWWDEVAGIARELLEHQPADELAAVCVSGMGPCVLLADSDGTPVRPAILYGIDTRAEVEIGELEAEFGRDDILSRCGSPLTSQAVGTQAAVGETPRTGGGGCRPAAADAQLAGGPATHRRIHP